MMTITLHQPNQPPRPVDIAVRHRAGRLYLILESGQPLALSADAATWNEIFEPAPPAGPPAGPPATGARFLNPTAKNWDWLTPTGVIDFFKRAPNLRSMLADVRSILAEDAEDAAAPSQLEADLAAIRPHLAAIRRDDGTINKSELARRLGLSPGGTNWQRLTDLAEALEQHPERVEGSSSYAYQASYPAAEAQNALTTQVRRRRAA